MRDFEGKTAVVTGGASGMGLAFAQCFAREGMNIVIADIEEKALRPAAAGIEALGASVLAVQTDVADAESMDHLGEATHDAFGAAHILCLNAGVTGGAGPIETLTLNDWKWALDVNLYGIIHGLRVFLGGLKQQNEGHVVITASVAGLTSHPGIAPYNASKHAAVTIAETLYGELKEESSAVHVSALCPGIVATQILTSDRNRPKELTNEVETPARITDEERAAMEAAFGVIGKPADEVAELVLAAIVEERFWVETDGHFRDPIKARHRSIESQTDPPVQGSILDKYTAG